MKTIVRRAAVSLLLFALFLPSCGAGEERKTFRGTNGTLVGLEFRETNGMMWGEDFELVLTEDTVVYSRRFSRLLRRYVERENRSLSAKRWNQIGAAAAELKDVLEEVSAPPEEQREPPYPTDSGGKSGFWLTWRADDGEEKTVRYYLPSDPRFDALIAVLKKIA